MNRISIPCACLALLALSSPGLAQSAGASLAPAGRGGPLIAPVVSPAMARPDLQPRSRLAADSVDARPSARRAIVTGAATGLALGAIGLTVRDLAHGDQRTRNLGTDLAIVGSMAVVVASLSWLTYLKS